MPKTLLKSDKSLIFCDFFTKISYACVRMWKQKINFKTCFFNFIHESTCILFHSFELNFELFQFISFFIEYAEEYYSTANLKSNWMNK